jgi:hypothetical protein
MLIPVNVAAQERGSQFQSELNHTNTAQRTNTRQKNKGQITLIYVTLIQLRIKVWKILLQINAILIFV